MTDVVKGNHLQWQAADTTGIIGAVKIIAIFWVNTDSYRLKDAEELSITDQQGIVLLKKRTVNDGEGFMLVFPSPVTVDGLLIPTLEGGELFIWTDTPVFDQS